jgi:hypothetical protein
MSSLSERHDTLPLLACYVCARHHRIRRHHFPAARHRCAASSIAPPLHHRLPAAAPSSLGPFPMAPMLAAALPPLLHRAAATAAADANLSTFSSTSSSSTSLEFQGEVHMVSTTGNTTAAPTSSQFVALPLPDCPNQSCQTKIICLRSRAGEIFHKFSNHYKVSIYALRSYFASLTSLKLLILSCWSKLICLSFLVKLDSS